MSVQVALIGPIYWAIVEQSRFSVTQSGDLGNASDSHGNRDMCMVLIVMVTAAWGRRQGNSLVGLHFSRKPEARD
jgi:hypothetical protein